MKKQNKSRKLADCFDAFKCAQNDTKFKRSGTKDGSIATHPVVPVSRTYKSEAEVLKACMKWLHTNGVKCDRNNTGTGVMSSSGIYSYGIKGGGDIIGLRRDGIHLEIECKNSRGGRLSEAQQQRWRDIEANNGVYLVIHGIEELEYYKEFILV